MRRPLLADWRHGEFGRSVFTLASGTALAQALGVLATPWLARLYTPSDFGATALWIAVVSMTGVLACGRYEVAIVLPEHNDDALNLLALSVTVAAGVSLILTLILAIAGERLAATASVVDLFPWGWLIPPVTLMLGLQQSLSYWSTRVRSYTSISRSQVATSFCTHGSQLGAGLSSTGGVGGLIGGRVAGTVVGTLVLLRAFVSAEGTAIRQRLAWRRMMAVGRRFSQFPRHLLLAHVLNTLVLQMPIFILTRVSMDLAGLFGLSLRLLGIPMTLLSTAIGQVFYAEAARENRMAGSSAALYQRTFKRLTVTTIVVFLPIAFIGDRIYVFLLGADWNGFASVIRSLLPLYMVRFVSGPLASTFLVAGKTRAYVLYQVAATGGAVMGLLLGHLAGGGVSYIWGYSLAVSVVSLAMLPVAYRLALQGWSPDDDRTGTRVSTEL